MIYCASPFFGHVMIAVVVLMLAWVNSYCTVTLPIPEYSFGFVSFESKLALKFVGVFILLFSSLHWPFISCFCLCCCSCSSSSFSSSLLSSFSCACSGCSVLGDIRAVRVVLPLCKDHCHTLVHGCAVTSSLPVCTCCMMLKEC